MKALKIFTLLILSIAVVSAAEITLEANKTAMPKGDVVQVDVYVNGTNIGSVLLNLTYEPTKLSLIDRVRYGVFGEEQFKTGANYVAFIGAGGSISGKTKVATLGFKATGVATTTNVTPVSSAVNGAPVTVLPEKVTITILDYEVINSTWRNPFTISIAGMTSFASLPVDDPSDGINWTKVDLPADCKNGVGNNTFIMVRKGSENKVLIYLEGGGACSSYASCGGPASTVTTLEPEFDTGTRPLKSTYVKGIFDVKSPLNPFRNWTMVFVPYSTGDIHMGNRVVKYYNISNPLQNKTIYHIGYVNAIVAMRWINASGNFDPIVVTGTSAGGFGTILHFYRASEIFGKGIIAINDAGPGTAPNVTSALPPAATAERWGSMQSYPPQSLPYFADTDTIRFLNWALNGSAGGCGNCIYALFEDQWDFVIGPYFQGYNFTDYQARLLNAIASIKANFSTRFCSYLPLSTYHTAFAGGYNYPAGDRFYNLHIDGYTLVQWINSVLSGNCVDKRDLGLRDLQVEILSAPSSAIVGNAYNITVKVSNVGSNATPDPFFVILSNATATLGYKVMTLPANSNTTFNFTWIPTTAGTERLNVTLDGLLVPALATLLPLGSVVELYGFPASEANNTASLLVSICGVKPVSNITLLWGTPYDVALSSLPRNTTVTLGNMSNITASIEWLEITDPIFPQFKYSPITAAEPVNLSQLALAVGGEANFTPVPGAPLEWILPPYRAVGMITLPPDLCGVSNITITTYVTVPSIYHPFYAPSAGIYPDGRPLAITDTTLFNQPGTYKKVTVNFGGLERTYYYYIPSSYIPTKPTPLVFVFHGGGSSGLAAMLPVDEFAERYGFILVTPDAYQWVWNRTRDVPFVARILEDMGTTYNIDKSRVYALGISNGAMMTTWLTFDLADKIAAVGLASGMAPELLNGTLPSRPITIVMSAGTGERVMGVPLNTHVAARAVVQMLLQAWNCTPTPETKFWPSNQNDPNTNVTRYVYTGCKNNVKVVYFEVGNGGHIWMGGVQYSIPASVGWATKHVDTWDDKDGMWAYLKLESLPAPATPRPIVGGGAGGGGAMPGVPVYITAYETVKANEESTIDLPQSAFWETNVVALLILSSEDNNIRFRIEKLKELPPGIPEPKGDLVVLILSIEPTLSKEASIKGKIKFGIPIEDIKAKGFDPNAVAVILLKWNGKEWIELPTKFVGSDGKYNYYEAETTSFSYFVAQLKPLETPKPTTPVATPPPTTVVTTPPPTTTPAPGFIPGFEALFAIAGLLAVAYLLRRKN